MATPWGSSQVLPKKTFEIDEISFSPDSTKLAASGQELATETNMHNGVNTYSIGGDLLLWDVTQKREIKVKAQEGTSVAAYGPNVSFSANGKQIVTGALVPLRRNSSSPESDEEQESASYARLLMIVDPQTGLTADELRVGRGNALLLTQSPDGQHVITANEQTLRSWDIVNHKLDAKFEPKLDPAGEAAGHAESPDSNTASSVRTIKTPRLPRSAILPMGSRSWLLRNKDLSCCWMRPRVQK